MSPWSALKICYGGGNLARKLTLMIHVSQYVQGDNDVSSYFDKLSTYWQELDAIKKVKSCASSGMCICCKEFDDDVQEEIVVKFLLGLNDGFAIVRLNIFTMSQVPNIDKMFDMVKLEESQRNTKKDVSIKSSALYGNVGGCGRFNNVGRGGFGRGRPMVQCSNCQMPRH